MRVLELGCNDWENNDQKREMVLSMGFGGVASAGGKVALSLKGVVGETATAGEGMVATQVEPIVAATGGGSTTYEILDGVRRSKAAQIAGQGSIEAEIQVGGRIVGRESIALNALRSPKEVISTAGSGLERWLNTLRQTLSGSKPPPIQVVPGTRGTPITDVLIK